MKISNETIQRIAGDFRQVELGDPRRTRRIEQVVSRLAQSPEKSLPELMESQADLEGCYRILNNESVTVQEVHSGHAAATRERAQVARNVLVIHDTTTCQFAHADASEIGYLSTGKAGFFAHTALVVDRASWRRPLGVVHVETRHRKKRSGRGNRKRKVSGSETARWKDKESDRWWRGVEQSRGRLQGCESVIHLADREGDSYALLGRMAQAGDRFVVRVNHDRRAQGAKDSPTRFNSQETVKSISRRVEGVVEREIPLSARRRKTAPCASKSHPPRNARLATLCFAATIVSVKRPRYLGNEVPPRLELNVVHVYEPKPPEGEPAVEWFLYTTEPVTTSDEVAEVVDIYQTRWLTEEFYKALKTGCLYEKRQLESRHALLLLLALSLPIACELLWLRSRARSEPNAPATDVLTPLQLIILRKLGPRPLPDRPTAPDALWAVAGLGGHVKANGYPGWRVLHRGLSKLLDYEQGWRAACDL